MLNEYYHSDDHTTLTCVFAVELFARDRNLSFQIRFVSYSLYMLSTAVCTNASLEAVENNFSWYIDGKTWKEGGRGKLLGQR